MECGEELRNPTMLDRFKGIRTWYCRMALNLGREETMKAILISAIAIFALQGCTVIQSTRLANGAAADEGVVYYLPKKLLKVEFTRAPAATKPEVEKAAAALQAAKATLEAATEAAKVAKERRDQTTVDTDERRSANEALGLANADVKVAAANVQAATDTAAKAKADHLSALQGKPPLVDSFNFTVLPSAADTRFRYSATLNHHSTRSDKLDLKTNTAGLLTNSTAKAEDQSAQILVSLAQSIAARGGGAIDLANRYFEGRFSSNVLGAKFIYQATDPIQNDTKDERDRLLKSSAPTIDCGNGLSRPESLELTPFRLDLIFDPTEDRYSFVSLQRGKAVQVESTPWSYLESALCAQGADYAFRWNGPEFTNEGTEPQASQESKNGKWPGLFYRRNLLHSLIAYKGQRFRDVAFVPPATFGADGKPGAILSGRVITSWGSLTPLRSMTFDLPNSSPTELLKVTSGAFSTTEHVTEFQDGVLVAHKEERPSELLSVAKIPYDVAKALIKIPAEILSLKVDYSSKEAALIDAQTAILAAKKALKEAEDAAKKAGNSQ